MKVICTVVCVFVDHVALCRECKRKDLFCAGMNRWFRGEYFVEKSPNAVINKGGWITVTRKYLFNVLKFTVKRVTC